MYDMRWLPFREPKLKEQVRALLEQMMYLKVVDIP